MWLQALLFAGFLATVLVGSATTYYILEAPMQRIGCMVAKRFDQGAAPDSLPGVRPLPEFLPGEGHLDTMTSI
jgi:hypothetical protein